MPVNKALELNRKMAVEIRIATEDESQVVAELVTELLLELEPQAKEELIEMNLPKLTLSLLSKSKIVAFIAYDDEMPISILTLHECAAIYAGGSFGEISELFVKPKHRGYGIGKKLLQVAKVEANNRHWKRIEVGAPNKAKWSRTIDFYLQNDFKEIGPRLRSVV